MAEPKPLTIAELLSGLTGRRVNVTQLLKPNMTGAKQSYGVYLVKPKDSVRIVQIDLPLLGSLGGALLGVPSEGVREKLASAASDEPLRDAIHEVLNVASTIVSVDDRAVLDSVYLDAASFPKNLLDSLKNPAFRSYFSVTVDGYDGGAFSIFALI